MRKFIAVIAVLTLMLILTGMAQASPQVVLDGRTISFDVPPTIENDRTMVPLRAIFEALGAAVQWDDATQTVTATKAETEIKLVIGGNAYKNGEPVYLDVPAKLMNDRTMVPLRFVSEAMGCQVYWNDATETVTITSTPGDNVVKIGLISPLTGDVKTFGASVRKGFELALSERNYKVGNYQVLPVIADDRNDPVEAVNAANELITQDKVCAVVGSITSKVSIPISSLANDNQVVMITPTATNPRVTVENNQRKEYIFRACFIDPFQGTAAARFAYNNLNARTAAVLYDIGNDYTIGLANSFKSTFTQAGGKILVDGSYSMVDVDFSTVLSYIAQKQPDILYLPDYYQKVSIIGLQARSIGVTSVFLGGDGWDSTDLDYDAMDGGYFTGHYSPDDSRPEVQDWINRYRAKYGSQPDVFAALGYDSTIILLKAIETAGSSDPARIKEALQNLKDFPAVTGNTSFGQDGNPIKPAVIFHVKDGKQLYITSIEP